MKSNILFPLVLATSLAPLTLRAEEAGSGHYLPGANAFYYRQITGDSGSGAVLGGFEGRTIGVGPLISYATKIGPSKKVDLVAELKWLPELDVERRLEGDTTWFKLALLF